MTLFEKTVDYKTVKTWEDEEFENDIKSLIEWQNKQPHLPDVIDDGDIRYFYQLLNRNVQTTKKAIDVTYTNISEFFSIYSNWDTVEESINRCFDLGSVTVLPQLSPSNEYVFVFSLFDTDPEKYVYEDVCMAVVLLNESLMLRHPFPLKSTTIYDCSKFTFQHILANNFARFKHVAILGKRLTQHSTNGIHIVNLPVQMNLLRTFIQSYSKKSKYPLLFHTEEGSLFEHFPKNMLPKEVGGTGPDLRELNEASRKEALSMLDRIRTRRQTCLVDESKRPESSGLRKDDMFGAEGSFKKLQID